MKILYLTHSLHMGGVEKNLLLLSEELIKNGHEIIVGGRDGVVRPMLEEIGVTFVEFKFDLRNLFSIYTDSLKLKRLVKCEKLEVIHSFAAACSTVLFMSKIVAGFGKFPYTVSSVMGLQNSESEKDIVTNVRNFLTVLGTKTTFVISPKIRYYLEKLPINRKRLIDFNVVGIKRPLIDFSDRDIQYYKEALNIPQNNKVVITIGHIHPRKSHDLFVKMASEVLKSRDDVTFLIVGDGPLKIDLENQIINTGYKDNIKLLGLRNDIYELLSISDICIKPGVVEGFIGITVLEAQVMGVPVIAFNTVDVQLAIKDEKTGLIVPPGDTIEMANAVIRILSDNNFSKELSKNGKNLVLDIFTIESISKKLVNVYKQKI